ncbi:Zn-dependent exopeptidase [Schizophyllum commune Tattone D]|nr:Zn-dependent exopeptidase [Schizophyllum commune Tattone D]
MESLLRDLVDIESLTGDEGRVGEHLAGVLRAKGFTVELLPIATGSPRANVYAYLGDVRETRCLLTTHIDTVPPFIPFSGPDAEGKVYGRGTCDAKGAAVAMIEAAERLIAAKEVKPGDLALLFVVGEEVDGVGMKAASEIGLRWESIAFGEPTDSKLALGHKGILLLRLQAQGHACHSGYPHLGHSANHTLVTLLADILKLEFPRDPLLGPSSVNVGTISGGEAPNILSPSASATVSIRVACEFDTVKRETLALIGRHPEVSYEIVAEYPPPNIQSSVPGFDTINVGFGTDIPFLKYHDGPEVRKYLYGPGSIFLAHTANEHVALADLEACADGYRRLILHCLSTKP